MYTGTGPTIWTRYQSKPLNFWVGAEVPFLLVGGNLSGNPNAPGFHLFHRPVVRFPRASLYHAPVSGKENTHNLKKHNNNKEPSIRYKFRADGSVRMSWNLDIVWLCVWVRRLQSFSSNRAFVLQNTMVAIRPCGLLIYWIVYCLYSSGSNFTSVVFHLYGFWLVRVQAFDGWGTIGLRLVVYLVVYYVCIFTTKSYWVELRVDKSGCTYPLPSNFHSSGFFSFALFYY